MQRRVRERIKLTGSMPRPKIRKWKRGNNHGCIMRSSTDAHAHASFYSNDRGLICISPKALKYSKASQLELLAHELAHLKCPRRAHKSKKFQSALTQFYRRLSK